MRGENGYFVEAVSSVFVQDLAVSSIARRPQGLQSLGLGGRDIIRVFSLDMLGIEG
jgi:hypothetical protein